MIGQAAIALAKTRANKGANAERDVGQAGEETADCVGRNLGDVGDADGVESTDREAVDKFAGKEERARRRGKLEARADKRDADGNENRPPAPNY